MVPTETSRSGECDVLLADKPWLVSFEWMFYWLKIDGFDDDQMWKWFMGLIIQWRAVLRGVRKRNSSAFTFKAHNPIEHMFNVSWFAFMSAKDGKIRERERKRSSLKWKIHVRSRLRTMLRTGFSLTGPEPVQHLSQLLTGDFFSMVLKLSVYTESIKTTFKAVLPTGASLHSIHHCCVEGACIRYGTYRKCSK